MKNSRNTQTKTGKLLETDVTRLILDYLRSKGHFAFKHWSGGQVFGRSRKGVADIIGVKKPDGTAIFLEVKLPGNEARDDQIEFLYEASSKGAITGVVHSLEEVKSLGL